jgi:hypothetical protein
MLAGKQLSLSSLLRVFRFQVAATWTLTLLETILLASLPLLMGLAIDGLIADDWQPFYALLGSLVVLLTLGVARRLYDTRAYGTMRVEIGAATISNKQDLPLSAQDARLDMSRELVDFLEVEAPLLLVALVHCVVAIVVLWSFAGTLALAAIAAALISVAIYAACGGQFFDLNSLLNSQSERQVAVLESGERGQLRQHLILLRLYRVKLSDLEALVYGLIFATLLTMLSFNLWFATTQTSATPGEVFTIVVYSYEFIDSAVALPLVLQSVTRIWEITRRINPGELPD